MPAPSLAWQVTRVEPGEKSDPEGGVQVGVRSPSHASVAVATKVTFVGVPSGESTTMLAGHVTVGGTVSSTFTVKEQPPLLPELSEAVHMILVIPTGKLEPDVGSQVTVGVGSHASVAVT